MKTTFFCSKWVCTLSIVVCVSLLSCNNMMEEEQPTAGVISGNYKGSISFDKFVSYEGDTETVLNSAIEARLNDKMISITDFPVYTILSVIEGEKMARAISGEIDVNYYISYSASLTETNRIRLILDPGPLQFSYISGDGQVNDVKIFFGTGIKTSAYEADNLQLKIILEEIRINGVPLFIMDEQYVTLQLYKVN